MSGDGYLFTAYAATWIIHVAYLVTIVRRYSRLKNEIDEMQKPVLGSQVSDLKS
jgi:CcmD family protein